MSAVKRMKTDATDDGGENRGKQVYGAPAQIRDIVGYGASRVDPKWPNGAKVALNIVLNYEEGGEACLLHGDNQSEHLLSEIVGAAPIPKARHANMESLYEYGSRAGFWRLHRILKDVPVTVYAVGMALERNPEAAAAMAATSTSAGAASSSSAAGGMAGGGWEVASHGYRWIDYQNVDEATEREHIAKTVDIHKTMLGQRPLGIYQGKPNVNTRKLVVEEGGFLYDSDSYADDLPYWNFEHGRPHLVVPYTLSENDMRFAIPNGFSHGGEFSKFLIDSLKFLVEEAKEHGGGTMMSVGLHCRLAGRPGRAAGLQEFLDFVKSLGDDVWVCRRDAIAKHWYQHHWPEGHGPPPKEALS